MGSFITSQINKFFSESVRKILLTVKNTSFLATLAFLALPKFTMGLKINTSGFLVGENNE
jgi:hypothetical protein